MKLSANQCHSGMSAYSVIRDLDLTCSDLKLKTFNFKSLHIEK